MHQKNKAISQGIFFAFINSICFGVLGIIDKLGASQSANPFIFSTQSIAFSLLFTLIMALIYLKQDFLINFKKIPFSSWRLIFLVGLFASGFFVLFRFLGLTQSTGTFATISQVITTLTTTLLAAIILHERLSKKFWALFAIIISAVYLVSTGKISISTLKGGDIFIIMSALFLAFGNIFSQLAVKKISAITLATGRFLVGFIFLLLANLLLFQNSWGLLTFNIWAPLSGLFWAIIVLVFNSAIQKIGLTLTLSIIMTAPVYTMTLEYLLLKQNFNLIQIVAACVVMLGGITMVLTQNKKK